MSEIEELKKRIEELESKLLEKKEVEKTPESKEQNVDNVEDNSDKRKSQESKKSTESKEDRDTSENTTSKLSDADIDKIVNKIQMVRGEPPKPKDSHELPKNEHAKIVEGEYRVYI